MFSEPVAPILPVGQPLVDNRIDSVDIECVIQRPVPNKVVDLLGSIVRTIYVRFFQQEQYKVEELVLILVLPLSILTDSLVLLQRQSEPID